MKSGTDRRSYPYPSQLDLTVIIVSSYREERIDTAHVSLAWCVASHDVSEHLDFSSAADHRDRTNRVKFVFLLWDMDRCRRTEMIDCIGT